MRRITTAVATILFAGSLSAGPIYQGFGEGNPDLQTRTGPDVQGIQPSVGDSVDVYGPLGTGNPDLFKRRDGNAAWTEDPEVYHLFSGGSDLQY
jgi:hypothetical protein